MVNGRIDARASPSSSNIRREKLSGKAPVLRSAGKVRCARVGTTYTDSHEMCQCPVYAYGPGSLLALHGPAWYGKARRPRDSITQ